jgi:hypothetical protein
MFVSTVSARIVLVVVPVSPGLCSDPLSCVAAIGWYQTLKDILIDTVSIPPIPTQHLTA